MTVKKSADNQTAELDVADQGTGLPESQRARVMRPFERGESARSGVTGSGLGLAIVDRIVRRSGGTVVLGDALPHGLLVKVQFPLIQRSTLKKALKEQDKAALKLEKEEEKKKERQREEEHGKGVMDEIRPEKWRIHPMELLVFALVIVIAVILFSKPWNYLIAIVLFLAFGLYIWNRMKVGKKQVKTEPEIILEEITQEEEKVPIEKLRWEKSHITAELKEKKIQYDNLGEQLAELDEVNERSREYEMKRQAVQMAADHLEQLSEEMRGYLKRDLNEKASSFICEITGGKYKKLVTDEKLHVSLMTDEKRVEIEQVSRGTVEQVYLALRMAVGELLCEEEMPVILDDAFAYYDEERMLQTLRWLKEHKKQVIIFTCQTREEQVMKEAGLVYHKIEL